MSETLTLNEYQKRTRETAIYPWQVGIVYPALGLAGEAGEFCEKLKDAMFRADEVNLDTHEQEVLEALTQVAIAGRFAEAAKKRLRDTKVPPESLERLRARVNRLSAEQCRELLKENGDQAWYLAALAQDQGSTLGAIAQANLDKLADRKKRNQLQGSGDNR